MGNVFRQRESSSSFLIFFFAMSSGILLSDGSASSGLLPVTPLCLRCYSVRYGP